MTAFTEWQHLLQGAKHKIIVYSDLRNLLFSTKPQLLTPNPNSNPMNSFILFYFNFININKLFLIKE